MTPRTVNDLVWTVPGFLDTVASSILYSATNTNLRPFAASGGKLILWHGWADQHISPQVTLQYWETMTQVSGKTDFARFYLFPGMAMRSDTSWRRDGAVITIPHFTAIVEPFAPSPSSVASRRKSVDSSSPH